MRPGRGRREKVEEMSAENVHQDTGLLDEEPSQVPDAVVETANLQEAVLDSVADQADDEAEEAIANAGAWLPDSADTDATVDPLADVDADTDDESAADDADSADTADAAEPAAAPPTGTMSAERIALKALEQRLLGGERKLR